MASLAETRDNETGNHIRRTQRYVKALAEALRQHPHFAARLSDHLIAMLFKSARFMTSAKLAFRIGSRCCHASMGGFL